MIDSPENQKLPLTTLLLLSTQYALVSSIYLVIVIVILSAGNVAHEDMIFHLSFAMIALAIASIIQSSRNRFIGTGYFAPSIFSAIYVGACILAIQTGGIGLFVGMCIFSGLVEIGIALIFKKLRRLFSPLITGFIVLMVGIDLGTIGFDQLISASDLTSSVYGLQLLAGLTTLAVIVACSVWGNQIVRMAASIIGILTGTGMAGLMHITHPVTIIHSSTTPWLALPHLPGFSIAFRWELAPIFAIAAIAGTLRSAGVITTCQMINKPGWNTPDIQNIRKGLFGEGFSIILAGVLGVPPTSISPSLVGIAKSTKITSRYIGFALAIILLICSFLPKVIVLFLLIPKSVIGAALIFTSSFMIIGGIQIMSSRPIDTRGTFIIGISLLAGVGREVYASYFEKLPEVIHLLTGTVIAISAFCAIGLNLLFRIGIWHKKELFYTTSKDKKTIQETLLQLPVAAMIKQRASECMSTLLPSIAHYQNTQIPIQSTVKYDNNEIEVKISYTGTVPNLFSAPGLEDNMLEEQPFSLGLLNLINHQKPDDYECKAEKDQVKITLRFY